MVNDEFNDNLYSKLELINLKRLIININAALSSIEDLTIDKIKLFLDNLRYNKAIRDYQVNPFNDDIIVYISSNCNHIIIRMNKDVNII